MGTLATDSPATLMADYVTAKLAPNTGWSIFVGKMPATPDKMIAFMDSPGESGIPNLLVDYPGIQVLVRGSKSPTGYTEAYLKARLIRDHILGMPNAPAEFVELDGVTERGSINPLGYDANDRPVLSNNFQLIVEPLTNAATHRMSL